MWHNVHHTCITGWCNVYIAVFIYSSMFNIHSVYLYVCYSVRIYYVYMRYILYSLYRTDVWYKCMYCSIYTTYSVLYYIYYIHKTCLHMCLWDGGFLRNPVFSAADSGPCRWHRQVLRTPSVGPHTGTLTEGEDTGGFSLTAFYIIPRRKTLSSQSKFTPAEGTV